MKFVVYRVLFYTSFMPLFNVLIIKYHKKYNLGNINLTV